MKLTSKIFLGLTIIYAFMIFYLSSIPYLVAPKEWLLLINGFIRSSHNNDYLLLFAPLYPLIKQPDKVIHILLYFGLGILLFLTLKSMNKSVIKAVIFAFVLGVLYGAGDEFHQLFVAGRTAGVMDFIADAAGVLIAQAIVIIIYATAAVFSYMHSCSRSKS